MILRNNIHQCTKQHERNRNKNRNRNILYIKIKEYIEWSKSKYVKWEVDNKSL